MSHTDNTPAVTVARRRPGSLDSCACIACGASAYSRTEPLAEDALLVVRTHGTNPGSHVMSWCPECAYLLEVQLRTVRLQGR
jgi:hypothetical protein